MENPKSLVIKNAIAFVIGMILIGYGHIRDTSPIYFALIGGYISLSLYYAWRFGMIHYGNLFSVVIFYLLPFALVFAIFVSLIVGFFTSIPRFIYAIYQWRKYAQKRQPRHMNKTPRGGGNNVVRFQPRSR